MSKNKEETATITMTEAQLERVIKTAVKTALCDLKKEDELTRNKVDELKNAPVTFSLLQCISLLFLFSVAIIFIIVAFVCIKLLLKAFNDILFGIVIFSILIVISSVLSAAEINRTKKIEVINTVFNAIMALSSLIVAVVGTIFAYKALK